MARLELTSREKIGQLFMVGFLGTSVTPDLASFLKEYKPGGVILFSRNLESVEQIVELTNDLQQCSPQSPLVDLDRSGRWSGLAPAQGLYDFPALRTHRPMPFRRAGLCGRRDDCQRAESRRHQHEHGAGVGRQQQSRQSRHRRSGLRLLGRHRYRNGIGHRCRASR